MITTHLIPLPALNAAIRHLVCGFGSSADEVEAVSSNLIDANLCGHDSHGIGMLPRYADAFLEGGLKTNVRVNVLHDAGALLRLDGGAGFGQVIGQQAMALGIERAHQHGTCIVALGNAHHLGRIGAWAEQAAAAGLVSLHFVNVIARAIVAPFGGADARFGTNPFCAGVPISGRPPVIVDFATSMIAQGKTRVAMNKGELVPPDCLIDDQGRPTQEPRFSVVPPFGALLPFGGQASGHKGYGLALLCELLGGALAAGMTQRNDDASKKRVLNGMFSVLVDPAQLSDRAAYEKEALSFIDWLQASPVREGFDGVQLAGDAERKSRALRSAQGVPMDAATWLEILQAATRLGVDTAQMDRLALAR
jgi:hydroxycarboxylate dehydrogenase B